MKVRWEAVKSVHAVELENDSAQTGEGLEGSGN